MAKLKVVRTETEVDDAIAKADLILKLAQIKDYIADLDDSEYLYLSGVSQRTCDRIRGNLHDAGKSIRAAVAAIPKGGAG